MYPKINHLSFISEDFYIKLITIILAITLVIAVIFFTLYIYSNKKEKLISLKQLKNSYRFYQIYDLISFVTVFLTIFLWVLIFVLTPVEVSGTSMENTFNEDDKLIVWHLGFTPERNDVVIIDSSTNYPSLSGVDFIVKRVIAISGDEVEFVFSRIDEDGYVRGDFLVGGQIAFRDGKHEQFLQMLTNAQTGETFYYTDNDKAGKVPQGYTIVFGDNRINSYDSKAIGLINNDDIIGKCIMRIFPLDKFGFIG